MEETQKYLDDLLTTIAREQNYENCKKIVKQIDSGGANYNSFIFSATISSAGKPDLKLFIKVASTAGEIRSNMEMLYRNETFFYNVLLKSYKNLEDRHCVPEEDRFRTANYYGCSTTQVLEALMLEDLSAKGFKTFDRFKSVTWHQTAESLGQLAKFHALSFVLLNEEPTQFENVKKEIAFATDTFETLLRSCLSQVIKATEEKDKKRITNFIESNINNEMFSKLFKPVTKEVIIHGDYRPNNLMYKTENEKCEVVTLDLQTIRCSSPVCDLMYFLDCGFYEEYREKYYQPAIDHYYAELRSALQRFKLNPDEVYSREDFDYELKEMLPYTVTLGMCLLLIISADEDTAPKETYEDYNEVFIENALFKKRLKEFIQFYSKVGVIP